MSRRVDYLNYLLNGGDSRELPAPASREDEVLYELCLNGLGLEQNTTPYVSAILNSSSAGFNYLSSIIDLKEVPGLTEGNYAKAAKVRFRFVLKDATEALPAHIKIKLFANNSANRDTITGAYANFYGANVITDPEANKEYILEADYPATDGTNALNTLRYLKPYLELKKKAADTAPNLVTTHKIDVFEISVLINNVVYNITDTARDFVPEAKGDIKIIKSSEISSILKIRKSPWYGKKASVLGDSITFGMKSGQTEKTVKEDNPWAMQLRELCGFSQIYNNGISSSTVAQKEGTNPMYARVGQINANSDLVIFMGGINDLAGDILLGEFIEDVAKVPAEGGEAQLPVLNTATYYGALQTIARDLKKRFLDAGKTVVFMTLLNAHNANVVNGVRENTKLTIEDFKAAIRKVAKHYGFIVFELQDAVKFDAFIEADRTAYITDGVHPNQAGHDNIAEVLSNYLNTQVPIAAPVVMKTAAPTQTEEQVQPKAATGEQAQAKEAEKVPVNSEATKPSETEATQTPAPEAK